MPILVTLTAPVSMDITVLETIVTAQPATFHAQLAVAPTKQTVSSAIPTQSVL
jgi:hypothetical protein